MNGHLVEIVARALYVSHGYVRPWEHPETQRIHGKSTRKAARAAIEALEVAHRNGLNVILRRNGLNNVVKRYA